MEVLYNMAKVLIKDGYTMDGHFLAQSYIAAVRYKYRPALPARVYDYIAADKTTGPKQLREAATLILEHLTAWDVDHPSLEGQAAPVTAEVLALVPQPVLMHMVNAICGYGEKEAAADRKN